VSSALGGTYPEIQPYEHGMLVVGDGDLVYWEVCGNPLGRPAVVLHGGPGSGCTSWQPRLFDPDAYRIVLFDQRNCGRSTPHASEPDIDLSNNTTPNLIADIERLREHLGVDRWLVTGGSWGSALGLAYAERHPDPVTGMVLWGVASARRSEFDWLFRGGVGAFFAEQWARLLNAVPNELRDVDVVEAYSHLLFDPDAEVRTRAAYEWCLWESATPSWPPIAGLDERVEDPAFALAFARLVTHYVRHDAWFEEDELLRGIGALDGIAAVLVQGRFDFQSPLGSAWAVHRAWPSSELVVVDDAGHDAGAPGIEQEIVRATDRFSDRPGGSST
jgi:proline iminopeptidase